MTAGEREPARGRGLAGRLAWPSGGLIWWVRMPQARASEGGTTSGGVWSWLLLLLLRWLGVASWSGDGATRPRRWQTLAAAAEAAGVARAPGRDEGLTYARDALCTVTLFAPDRVRLRALVIDEATSSSRHLLPNHPPTSGRGRGCSWSRGTCPSWHRRVGSCVRLGGGGGEA